MKNCTCRECGKRFVMGVNGVKAGKADLCDECANISRDSNRRIWHEWDKSAKYENIETGEIEVITRAEAFGKDE